MRLERFLGCHSGVSNNRIIEARESLLAEMVEKGLSQHPDQSSMAIKAWKNRDKLSTAFLLELPGPHNQWSSAEWGEALCLVLSLPPTAAGTHRNWGSLLATVMLTSGGLRSCVLPCQAEAGLVATTG